LPGTKNFTAGQSERPCQFISWVFLQAGLDVDRYRVQPLKRRLSACLRALHAESEAQARQILEQRPDLLPTAIGVLFIGVTEFFRDSHVFEALRTEVLPQLASPIPTRPLRVWSAGCSNGAELYSIAILLAQRGFLEGSFLLGSDCRLDAIKEANAALFNERALQKIARSDCCLYFEKIGSFWRPIELLRQHIHWKISDLAKGIEEGPWDIVLWRNMGIYLKAEAAEIIWRGLTAVLAPGGVIIVGRAERPPAALPLIQVNRCIYRSCFAVVSPLGFDQGAQSVVKMQETVI
jgi:chemotaxis protein methyltransferase CheR